VALEWHKSAKGLLKVWEEKGVNSIEIFGKGKYSIKDKQSMERVYALMKQGSDYTLQWH